MDDLLSAIRDRSLRYGRLHLAQQRGIYQKALRAANERAWDKAARADANYEYLQMKRWEQYVTELEAHE